MVIIHLFPQMLTCYYFMHCYLVLTPAEALKDLVGQWTATLNGQTCRGAVSRWGRERGKGAAGLLSAQMPFPNHKISPEVDNNNGFNSTVFLQECMWYFISSTTSLVFFLFSIIVERQYYISFRCIVFNFQMSFEYQ